MFITPASGLIFDQPNVAPKPFWTIGYNVRFRLQALETVGLFALMRDVDDNPIQLSVGVGPFRRMFTTPNTTFSQILAGSVDKVVVMEYDPNSTPAQGTRYLTADITPEDLPPASDILPNPSPGRVQIPPVWWFSDQDDLVVGSRAGVVTEVPYVWDRNRSNRMVPLAGAPLGAVGGGIINRVLVLLGCTSFTDPDPGRALTIRWSDRFNFEEWTPSDINISGELQLEGGSRIVGGGVTGFGVVAWTDKRMALLVENFDIDSVFTRKYIDSARGLVANNAWTEADGQVWWLDEARVLNVYDGGRPRQIPNPLKYGTIERLGDRQLARVYLEPNPEFSEVIIHFPDEDAANPDTQIVYNYAENAWTYWRFPRTGWHTRIGSIPNVAVSEDGMVYFHDVDVGLPELYTSVPDLPPEAGIALPDIFKPVPQDRQAPIDEIEPYEFAVYTNLITTESVTEETWRMTRIHADHLPLPSTTGVNDKFIVRLLGYGEAQIESPLIAQDWQSFGQGQNAADFRVGGKALRIGLASEGEITTGFRFSGFSVTNAKDGTR